MLTGHNHSLKMSGDSADSQCPLLKRIKNDASNDEDSDICTENAHDELQIVKEEKLDAIYPEDLVNCKDDIKKEGSVDDDKRFYCSHCSKTYACANSLRRHVLSHTGERPFSCTTCSKTFSQACNLKRHMLIHTGEKPYACSHCSRSLPVWIT